MWTWCLAHAQKECTVLAGMSPQCKQDLQGCYWLVAPVMVQSTPVVMLRRCVLLAACTRSLHLPQWVSFHCIRAAADGNNQASWL